MSIFLSWQKRCFVTTDTFVTTKYLWQLPPIIQYTQIIWWRWLWSTKWGRGGKGRDQYFLLLSTPDWLHKTPNHNIAPAKVFVDDPNWREKTPSRTLKQSFLWVSSHWCLLLLSFLPLVWKPPLPREMGYFGGGVEESKHVTATYFWGFLPQISTLLSM